MPKIQKVCKCGNIFSIYPCEQKKVNYCSRKCVGTYCFHKSGFKNSKGSLAKMGVLNPMYGKKHSIDQKKKISDSVKKYFLEHPDKFKLKGKFGKENYRWAGDNIGRYGVHDWIKSKKGLAKDGVCEKKDKTCKGRLEWSNKSQKYLRRIYDWQILCDSHHGRYDKHTHLNGLKTRFKKGQTPWNKKQ